MQRRESLGGPNAHPKGPPLWGLTWGPIWGPARVLDHALFGDFRKELIFQSPPDKLPKHYINNAFGHPRNFENKSKLRSWEGPDLALRAPPEVSAKGVTNSTKRCHYNTLAVSGGVLWGSILGCFSGLLWGGLLGSILQTGS